jgi:Tol biopolymer transport system component/DNA-binding winged helix-turn-helix (wHTH) protein
LIGGQFFEFGSYRLEAATHRLWRGGEPVPLTPKVCETLLVLVRHSGRIVSKEEIIKAVWPNSFVDEANLTQNISVLRRALREVETQTKYIATYPGKGYQFLGPVRTIDEGSEPPAAGPRRIHLRVWVTVGFTAIVLAAGLLRIFRSPIPGAELVRRQPFTRLPGAEYQPSFSRDGTKAAFVWDQEHAARPGIFVKGLGDDESRPVDRGQYTASSPAWSPDGRYLAYLRYTTSALSVIVKPERGAGEREVARLFRTRYGLNCRHLDWSPTGKLLVVDDKESPDQPFGLYLIDLETGARKRLTAPTEDIIGDVDPRFSPDGATVSFVRMTYRFNHELYTVPTAGGTPRQRTNDRKRISGQDWSADGRSLYFSSDRDGGFRVWKLSLDGRRMNSGITPTAITSSNPIQLSVSRSGSKLVYSDFLQDLNIWRLDLPRASAGQEAWSRVIASTAEDILPQLSPDGKRICFQSDRSGQGELWLSDAVGGNPVQLTRGDVRPAVGRWSPDGRTIVFQEAATGTMYLVDADGGVPRLVTGSPTTGFHPVFAADGRGLYLTDREKLFFLALPAGKPEELAGQMGFEKILSADGRSIYFTGGRTDPAIWRYTIATRDRQKVLGDLLQGYWGAWALSSKGIYYLKSDDQTSDEAAIYFHDFSSGQSTRVASFPDPLPPIGTTTWALTPDDRFLYVVRVDTSRSDLTLVDGLH